LKEVDILDTPMSSNPAIPLRRRLWAWLHAARQDRRARRARRVALLVILLWIVSAFDLVFTLTAHRAGQFQELNPIAARLLDRPALLVTFKVSLVTFASCILLAFRRRLPAEVACWTLAAAYAALSGVWKLYYLIPHA